MSAIHALKMAREAGVQVRLAGDDLVLEAAKPPSESVIELLSREKAEVKALLAAMAYEREEGSLRKQSVISQSNASPVNREPEIDEPCAARRGRVEEMSGRLLHFCFDCGRFGPYGYGVRLRAGQLGQWFCSEHRPENETSFTHRESAI